MSENDLNSCVIDVGARLRAARETAGLSLGEVADHLKVSRRQLEALEADDYTQLPELPFVRGMVRNYARFVQIEAAPLMAQLGLGAQTQAQRLPSETEPAPSGTGKWLAIAGGLLAITLIAWWTLGGSARDSVQAEQDAALQGSDSAEIASAVIEQNRSELASVPVASIAQASVPQAVAPAAAPLPAGAAVLDIAASEPAWVSVTDATGSRLAYQNIGAGERKQLSGTPPFKVRLGNAQQVTLRYQGKPVDFSGQIRGATAKLEVK